MLMNSWRESTKKQYNVYLKKWIEFCASRHWNPMDRKITHCLKFLLHLFKTNHSYSAINTARSSLSCIFTEPPIGEHSLVVRFMRSVFHCRPTIPRYQSIWDVSIVLRYLEQCAPCRDISLKILTYKLVTLCALVTGQRCQTIHAFNLNECIIQRTRITFTISTLLKHNSPRNNGNTIIIPAYPENKSLCFMTYLREYIKRTKPFRNSGQLFLSFHKPHKPVSKATISRWIKITLQKAGINTKIFKAHSTRAAATSAVQKDVDIAVILQAASWSNQRTFARFYSKPLTNHDKDTAFGKAVLQKSL